jgi:hypothetical protein
MIDGVTLARAIHVLALVHCLGSLLLPSADRMKRRDFIRASVAAVPITAGTHPW